MPLPPAPSPLTRLLTPMAWLITLLYFAALSRVQTPGSFLQVLAWLQWPVVGLTAFLVSRTVKGLESPDRGRLLSAPALTFLSVLLLSIALNVSLPYFWDAATSSARASMISHGQGLWSPSQRISLFYYFMALLQGISDQTVGFMRLANGLVAMSGLLGIGVFLRRHIGNSPAGLVIALAASQPVFFTLSHWLYIDMFMLAGCVWLLVMAGRLAATGKKRYLVLSLILAVAVLATKEYAWVVLPVALGLGWAEKRAAPWWLQKRRLLVLGVLAVSVLALVWLAGTVYFRFWRGLFPDQEPNWGMFPMIVVPGNPYLTLGQQWAIGSSFARQFMLGLAASGLLGLVWVGLVRGKKGRPVEGGFLAMLAFLGAAFSPLLIRYASLNQLFLFDHRLALVFWGLLALVLVLRLAGFLEFKVERIQLLLLGGLALSVLFFCLIGKVSSQGDHLEGYLDWRYLLPALLFLVLLAGFGTRNLLEVASAGPGRHLAFVALALTIVPNLVGGTNYLRQVGAFTSDQARGVDRAIALAEDRGVQVLTGWPYYYPESPRVFNQGPYRWRDRNIDLEFVWFHDFSRPTDAILLMDTRCLSSFQEHTRGHQASRFTSEVHWIEPLLPRVQAHTSPTVLVADLTGTRVWPELAGLVEDFSSNDSASGGVVWQGLGSPEAWEGGLTIRWTKERRATARFAPVTLKNDQFPLLVRLRARPMFGLESQSLSLWINGRNLGTRTMPPEWVELTWEVPAEVLRGGDNIDLAIEVGQMLSPADRPGSVSSDQRTLGAALDLLTVSAPPNP